MHWNVVVGPLNVAIAADSFRLLKSIWLLVPQRRRRFVLARLIGRAVRRLRLVLQRYLGNLLLIVVRGELRRLVYCPVWHRLWTLPLENGRLDQ